MLRFYGLRNQSASLLGSALLLPLSNAYHTPPVNGQCFGDKMEPVLPAQSLSS